jgi:hypothetical protein
VKSFRALEVGAPGLIYTFNAPPSPPPITYLNDRPIGQDIYGSGGGRHCDEVERGRFDLERAWSPVVGGPSCALNPQHTIVSILRRSSTSETSSRRKSCSSVGVVGPTIEVVYGRPFACLSSRQCPRTIVHVGFESLNLCRQNARVLPSSILLIQGFAVVVGRWFAHQ